MQKEIIFVSGVHGVGKSTFTKELEKILNIPRYSASELIKIQDKQLSFPDKKIAQVNSNQDVLLDSIDNNVKELHFILDGHFTLKNTKNEIVFVPKSTFYELNPKSIILLTDDANSILNRLDARSQNEFSYEFINKMQNAEISYAKEISNDLTTTLIQLQGFKEFKEFLDKMRGEIIYHEYN